MAQLMDRLEPRLNRSAIYRAFRHHAHDTSMGIGSDAPDMQVSNSRIAWSFNQLADFLGDMLVSAIKQHPRGLAHQRP